MIWNLLGKLFAGPEIWANTTYRKVMVMLYTLVFGYLGVLWMLSCVGGPGTITMTMWLFIAVFTVVYWQPRLGGLGALVEWFNEKDDPAKKSTWRLYLLVLLSSIVAGTLAIILRQIGAGIQFPLDILALATLVVICLLLPNKSRLDEWLPRIGAVVVILAIISTIILPMSGWSSSLYESTGYSMSVAPSKATIAARKAIAENERLADQATEQCILNWKNTHMGGRKVVREDQIAAAVAKCQEQWAPVSPSSQKEGAGNILNSGSLLGMGLWAIIWGHILWFVGAAILAALGWTFWKKKDDVAAATATKTVVVEKKKSQGWSFSPVGMLLWALIIWSLVSWFNGGWITSSADVSRLGNNISTIFDKKEVAPERKYPNAFLTPKEIKTWQATGTSPSYHPNFGEIAGRSFELVSGSYSGQRPSIVDRLDGGYGRPLIIILDENNSNRDMVLENTVCNPPRIYSDNNVHTVCVGNWRSGDRRVGGVAELDYSAEQRTLVLHSAKPSGEIETITFVFEPK